MKTAEEIVLEHYDLVDALKQNTARWRAMEPIYIKDVAWIKTIQDDAWRQGMEDAVKICDLYCYACLAKKHIKK